MIRTCLTHYDYNSEGSKGYKGSKGSESSKILTTPPFESPKDLDDSGSESGEEDVPEIRQTGMGSMMTNDDFGAPPFGLKGVQEEEQDEDPEPEEDKDDGKSFLETSRREFFKGEGELTNFAKNMVFTIIILFIMYYLI